MKQLIKRLVTTGGILALAASAGLSACNGGSSSSSSTTTTTIMYYAMGADDLPDIHDQIKQLVSIGSNANLNILVAQGGDSFSQTSMYYITPQHGISQLGESLPIPAINESSTLQEFVTTAMQKYPANRYMIFFSGHAGGTNSEIGKMPVSTMMDSFTQVHTVLGNSYKNIDLFAFDNCLMSDAEVAAGLAPNANYMVASQNFDYGWNIDKIVNLLVQNPNLSTVSFGEYIVNDYFSESSSATVPVKTLALTNLQAMSPVVTALNVYATQLAIDYNNGAAWQNYAGGLAQSTAFNTDPLLLNANTNLADSVSMLLQMNQQFPMDSNLMTYASLLESAINAAVIYKRNGMSNLTVNASGLSIYAPIMAASASANYATNTNGLFSNSYISLVSSYATYYSNNSDSMWAQFITATDHQGESYFAAVKNPGSLYTALTLLGFESLGVELYDSAQAKYVTIESSAYVASAPSYIAESSIYYTSNGDLSSLWLKIIDKANKSLPVIAILDGNNRSVKNPSYNIPAAKLESGGAISMLGYLTTTLDDNGNLQVNSFIDMNKTQDNATAQSFPVLDGEKYVPLALVIYQGNYRYAVPTAATNLIAPFTFSNTPIPSTSYTNSGISLLTFFNSDITGNTWLATPVAQ